MNVFISHTSEDKDEIVRDLARRLKARDVDVWYEEFVLRLGDSLRESIDRGLAKCDYGIVVLSPSFFAKRWPQQELNGLFAREMAASGKLLLPVWHKITAREIAEHSPMLADRYGVPTSVGINSVVRYLLQVLIDDETERRRHDQAPTQAVSYAHQYYNPPEDIPKFGYKLPRGLDFKQLISRLRPREVLMVFGRTPQGHNYAGYVMSEERMLWFQKDCEPEEPEYYAVDVSKLLDGFDTPLSTEEVKRLLSE